MHPEEDYRARIKDHAGNGLAMNNRPSFAGLSVDNLAELTQIGCAIYIDPVRNWMVTFGEHLKLPEMNHQDQFLEPMTYGGIEPRAPIRTIGPRKSTR